MSPRYSLKMATTTPDPDQPGIGGVRRLVAEADQSRLVLVADPGGVEEEIGLDGKVVQVSADSIYDEVEREAYFIVIVETQALAKARAECIR